MEDFDKINAFNALKKGNITCICGESGCGKSTLSKRIKYNEEKTIVFDGDGVRKFINNDLTFSEEDRKENNIRIAKIANYLSLQGFDVIISTVRADIAYDYLKNNLECCNVFLFKLEK